jgi:Mg-chelatase subunit ChlD
MATFACRRCERQTPDQHTLMLGINDRRIDFRSAEPTSMIQTTEAALKKAAKRRLLVI